MAYTILSRDTIRHRFDELDLIKVHICADTAEELPSADEVAKKCFVPGSTAETINDGSTYKLNHASEWVIQPGNTVAIGSGGSGGGGDQNVEWISEIPSGKEQLPATIGMIMRSVRIPEGIKSISGGTFSGNTALEEAILPESLEELQGGAFSGAGIRRLVIPKNVKKIGSGSLTGCPNLLEVVISDGVQEIGPGAFSGSPRLRDIIVPGSVKIIESGFASSTNFRDVKLEPGVTEIQAGAFSFCPIETISIPDTVTAIGNQAFLACDRLVSITIPGSVTSLASDAFKDSDNLVSITVKAAEGSIAGAPWGAPNPDVQVIWAP